MTDTNQSQSPTREAAENIAKHLRQINGKIKDDMKNYKEQKSNSSSSNQIQQNKKDINSLIDLHNQICDVLDSFNKWLSTYEGSQQTKKNIKR